MRIKTQICGLEKIKLFPKIDRNANKNKKDSTIKVKSLYRQTRTACEAKFRIKKLKETKEFQYCKYKGQFLLIGHDSSTFSDLHIFDGQETLI